MRKLVIALSLTAATLPAFADYTGLRPQPITVKQLQASGQDDQYVVLRGHITKQLRDKRYQFTDNAGTTIELKIKKERWPQGTSVNERSLLEISGEYDKELVGTSKIDVKEVKLLSGQ